MEDTILPLVLFVSLLKQGLTQSRLASISYAAEAEAEAEIVISHLPNAGVSNVDNHAPAYLLVLIIPAAN